MFPIPKKLNMTIIAKFSKTMSYFVVATLHTSLGCTSFGDFGGAVFIAISPGTILICNSFNFLDIAISLRCQGILQPSPLLQNSLLHTSFSQKGRSCIFAERLNSYKFTFISTEHLHKLAFAHFFRTAKHTNFCIALCIALCTHDEDGGGS